jgi:hypothetical protein
MLSWRWILRLIMIGKDKEVSYESQDLRVIETRLQRSLRPVSPRPDFITDLRKQLVNQLQILPTISRFGRSSVLWLALLLVIMVFGVFLLSLRAIVLMLSIVALLQQYIRSNNAGQDRIL